MKILIQGARMVDPATGMDRQGDVAIAAGRILALGQAPSDFSPNKTVDARGWVLAPGLVDLCARLREPGYEHEGMLESELAAAVAGGITSLVCPPDTDPVLDEPGLVEMLKYRAEKLHRSRVFPLGALTRGLRGESITEMVELTDSGCVGFGQAEVPMINTQVMQRALQYAATFGYTVWLRPQDMHLGKGVAASGALATRLGLSGIPVCAETIALYTIFELMRTTGARVHLCRISSAAGVQLIREAKAQGLPVSADVSINSLHLIDHDIGYFDSRARLLPPLRQQRDRDALQAALLDGTLDALVSDHNPVEADAKNLPFGEAEPGATGLELLLSLALKWGQTHQLPLPATLACVTSQPARVLSSALGTLASSLGQLNVGGAADLCVFDPHETWQVQPALLRSQGKHTPFASDVNATMMPGRVKLSVISGQIAYEAAA